MNMTKIFLVAMGLTLSLAASAKTDPVYTGFFSDLAVGGFDVVAYFEDNKPVEGSRKFKTEYEGAEWRFNTASHLDKFLLEPEKYAPRYGGYCAWAVSQGYTAKGDPENWTIVDGRLYLNYNDDVQADWSKDIPGFIALGDKNWPKLLAE